MIGGRTSKYTLWMKGFSLSRYRQVHNCSCICFITSVECQCLELPEVLERSIVGLLTVFKSLAIVILADSLSSEKKYGKNMYY